MFEAVHGTAPRLIADGLSDYANPCSLLRAAAMMLSHIGFQEQADKLNGALDFCTEQDKEVVMDGTGNGATRDEFVEYLCEHLF